LFRKAIGIGEKALAIHEASSNRNRSWVKDTARATVDALGRTDEAKALRERYGLGGPEGP